MCSRSHTCRTDLQHVGAVVGLIQESSLHDKAQHLLVGHALVRLLGQGGDLPQHDAKRPAVRNDAAVLENTFTLLTCR